MPCMNGAGHCCPRHFPFQCGDRATPNPGAGMLPGEFLPTMLGGPGALQCLHQPQHLSGFIMKN